MPAVWKRSCGTIVLNADGRSSAWWRRPSGGCLQSFPGIGRAPRWNSSSLVLPSSWKRTTGSPPMWPAGRWSPGPWLWGWSRLRRPRGGSRLFHRHRPPPKREGPTSRKAPGGPRRSPCRRQSCPPRSVRSLHPPRWRRSPRVRAPPAPNRRRARLSFLPDRSRRACVVRACWSLWPPSSFSLASRPVSSTHGLSLILAVRWWRCPPRRAP